MFHIASVTGLLLKQGFVWLHMREIEIARVQRPSTGCCFLTSLDEYS